MKIKYSSSKYHAKIVKNEFSHPRLEGERTFKSRNWKTLLKLQICVSPPLYHNKQLIGLK